MPRAARPRVCHSATRAPSRRHPQGPVDAHERCEPARVEAVRADLSRAHRASRGARSARRQDVARCGPHRPSRARPCSARSTAGARGRKRQRRRRSRPTAVASSITRSGSRRDMHRSRACGTRARRRKACSARTTAARRGKASTASTRIRSARRGAAATRTARPTARRCIRSSSTRAIPRTCISRCRAAACSSRSMPAPTGSRSTRAWPRCSCRCPIPEYGHDPHCVRLSSNPDRLYQQNHCGIYRLDRPATRWVRIGDNMPKSVGDIGLPMVTHPYDAESAWVFPMDGTDVWPRTSPGGKPAAYRTRDGGKTWKRQADGMPTSQALVDGEAASHERRPFHDRRRVLRHDVGRGVGQPRRRAQLEVPRAAPARDLRRRSQPR